jgi:hypothetical protein
MENEKITRENVAMHLVEYQLRMVEKIPHKHGR